MVQVAAQQVQFLVCHFLSSFLATCYSLQMHHDLGWWGFVLSVIALILLVPLNLLSNILTPKIQNWWAERSLANTRRRIQRIEEDLIEYQEMSEVDDQILSGIEGVLLLVSLAVVLCAAILLISSEKVPVQEKRPLEMLAAVAAIATALFVFGISTAFSRFRRRRSPFNRNIQRQYLEALKARLPRTED